MPTRDLGTVLSLSAGAILTTYTDSSAISLGRPGQARFTVKVVTVGGTAMTNVVVKLSASDDATNYYDVESSSDIDASSTAMALEHTVALSPGSTKVFSIHVDESYESLKISAKVTGGVGVAGESLVVTGRVS